MNLEFERNSIRKFEISNLNLNFEIKFRKFGIGQAQNLNCEARSVHLPDDRDRRGQGRREGDPARMVPESAGWAKLRALEGRPTGEYGSSEELVHVRNRPESRLYRGCN